MGNPNVGKSVIFSHFTGRYATVSNYPGTTVEICSGEMRLRGEDYSVIDTPGVNSLIPSSEDERVTRDLLLAEGRKARIIQVADAKNLRRALFLSLQLAEMGLSFILDLNMEDEANARGVKIDRDKLARILGVPIITTIAPRGKGVVKLKEQIGKESKPKITFRYSPLIEEGIRRITAILPSLPISRRALALMILAGDRSLIPFLRRYLPPTTIAKLERIRFNLQNHFPAPLHVVINRERLLFVDRIIDQVLIKEKRKEPSTFLKRLESLSMRPFPGILILVGVLFLVYEFVGVLGAGIVADFMEKTIFGSWINPALASFISRLTSNKFVYGMLVGKYGMLTMALTYAFGVILPVITFFFLTFAILEDSGYLPRMAVMSNRVFRWMGLNGKAILPLILGLGCDTMATITARTLDTKRERIIVTFLLALGIPCSAQLGVIMALIAPFPPSMLLIWFFVVLLVIFTAGFLANKLLPGEPSDFIMELPPMRVPFLRNIGVKTFARIEWYLKEVVPIFIIATFFLFILDQLKILPVIERFATPLTVSWLHLPPETAKAFIMGFFRRDYGAAGLFSLASEGLLSNRQILVSIITITLFVPCIANFLIIIKERGIKTALAVLGLVIPIAFLVGGVVERILSILG